MNALVHLGLIAFGSALGGLARYGVGNAVSHFTGWPLHWGTMFVNISGSLFLGWFLTMLSEMSTQSPLYAHRVELDLFIAIGFTGGYTTFSSFEAQTHGLLEKGLTWTAVFYVTGSVFLGLLAYRIGMLLAGGK